MYVLTFTFGMGVWCRCCVFVCDKCLQDLSETRAYLLTSVHIHVAIQDCCFCVYTRHCVSTAWMAHSIAASNMKYSRLEIHRFFSRWPNIFLLCWWIVVACALYSNKIKYVELTNNIRTDVFKERQGDATRHHRKRKSRFLMYECCVIIRFSIYR